eukprot:5735478-Pyramimonas_sp.AAC.1
MYVRMYMWDTASSAYRSAQRMLCSGGSLRLALTERCQLPEAAERPRPKAPRGVGRSAASGS